MLFMYFFLFKILHVFLWFLKTSKNNFFIFLLFFLVFLFHPFNFYSSTPYDFLLLMKMKKIKRKVSRTSLSNQYGSYNLSIRSWCPYYALWDCEAIQNITSISICGFTMISFITICSYTTYHLLWDCDIK